MSEVKKVLTEEDIKKIGEKIRLDIKLENESDEVYAVACMNELKIEPKINLKQLEDDIGELLMRDGSLGRVKLEDFLKAIQRVNEMKIGEAS